MYISSISQEEKYHSKTSFKKNRKLQTTNNINIKFKIVKWTYVFEMLIWEIDLICSFVWIRLLFKVFQAIKGMKDN